MIMVKLFLTVAILLFVTHMVPETERTRHMMLGFGVFSLAGALIAWIWGMP